MQILCDNPVVQRRPEVVKIEHAMGIEPLIAVQRNPIRVYTRRSGLKTSSCVSDGDKRDQCYENIMAVESSVGQEAAEVGPLSRKRPSSMSVQLGLAPSTPPDSFPENIVVSSQESTTTTTFDERVVSDENVHPVTDAIVVLSQESTTAYDERVASDDNVHSEAVMDAPRPKRSCRRSLRFSEENQESYGYRKEVIPAPCKYGCLREIRRMEPILSPTCRRKRIQPTRVRRILLLAHRMLPNLPRNCKRKRSSRQKNVKIYSSALICYGADKIDKKTSAASTQTSDACISLAMSSAKEVSSSVAPQKEVSSSVAPQKEVSSSVAPQKEVSSSVAPQKPDHLMSTSEAPNSVEPKKTCKQSSTPKKPMTPKKLMNPKKPPPARIRKATKSLVPDRNEVQSSVAPKKTRKEATSPRTKKSKKKDELENFLDMDIEAAVQIVAQKLESLKIDDVVASGRIGNNGAIVPYKAKEKLKPPKVLLDLQTLKVWNRTMFPGDGEGLNPDEEEQWNQERELFNGRVDSFIAKMNLTQGPRRFMPWKSSVVDSVVGVFLTQNVSDYLSSNAYLSLCAKFPARASENGNGVRMLEDRVEAREEVCKEIQESHEKNEEESRLKPQEVMEIMRLEDFNGENKEMEEEMGGKEEKVKIGKVEDTLVSTGSSSIEETGEIKTLVPTSVNGRENGEMKTPTSKKKKKGDNKVPVDWKSLRETIMKLHAHEPRSENHMDTVDWEKVRTIHQDELADTIKDRGQQNELARKIQEFLNRLLSLQGSIDLEWLRYCPPLKVKDYLLEINGLGLKSVECVRLLALQHVAFPVDVNVGRIAVRLGWVPLEPMAEIQFHLLDKYPSMDEIQKYLWPRLCAMDQQKLYELHYHLITFGKIFCTKKKPNCNACPLKGECRYFASVHASANALPAPDKKSMVASANSVVIHKKSSNFHSGSIEFEEGHHNRACEPIIEEPESPRNHSSLIETDIEDLCKDDWITSPRSNYQSQSLIETDIEDWIPVINLSQQSKPKDRKINPEDSKALVVLPPEVASYPTRKLKAEGRLTTEHQVYELPDGHPLIAAKFEPRVLDDPCPYLLAIWPGETASMHEGPCHATEEKNTETIRGSIMIPCRTATRARFPLNGTYFQVNEVFADDESSKNPIDVPTDLIWNLTRRIAYAGTSASSILKWKSYEDISRCFKYGFICVRGFDRRTRAPRPLAARFHLSLKHKLEQKGPSLRKKKVEKEQEDQSLDKKKETVEEAAAVKKSSVES